jgi:hypothetical protein
MIRQILAFGIRFAIALFGFVVIGCSLTPGDSTPSPPTATPTPAPTWAYVGSAGFSDGIVYASSISIDNGIIYVAYSDSTVSNKAIVKQFNGTSWDNVGNPGFSATPANQQISLVVYNNVPYLTFSGSTDLYEFTGSAWTTLGTAPFSGGGGRFLSIDSGAIYVAYGTTVSKWNGSSWDSIGTPEMNINNFCISSHQLYIAGQDTSAANTGFNVKLYSGAAWDNVSQSGFIASAPFNNELGLFIMSNEPIIVYPDTNSSNQLFCKTINIGVWQSMGTNPVTAYASYNPVLGLFGTSVLLAYQESSYDYGDGSYPIILRIANGSSWVTVGGTYVSEAGGFFPSLAISGNIAYIAYQDQLNANKISVRKIQLN